MVTGMMERDPEQRLTAQQALATPWIAGEGLGRTADIGVNVIAPLCEWQSIRGFDKAVIGVVAGLESFSNSRMACSNVAALSAEPSLSCDS